MFDFGFVIQSLPQLLKATGVTILATVLGMLIAATVGLALAIARRSKAKWLSWPTTIFVEFVRSTPLLVQLFFLFYVLPNYGLTLPKFATGVIALGLHYSTYTAEVYRSGLDGVSKGQWEAGMALGMPTMMRMQLVVVPQAIPPIIPALGNYLIAMFKETPLLSAIAVVELMQTAKILGSQSFNYLELYTMVGVIFLILSLISAAGIHWLEHRLSLKYRYARVKRPMSALEVAS